MRAYLARIRPRSAFGSSPKGDMLFGQLCWALRHRLGEPALGALLDGYTSGRPFCVVSDALPAGHWPRPMLPLGWYESRAGDDRKSARKRRWLPQAAFDAPLCEWSLRCVDDEALAGATATRHAQSHNSINRATGTTGVGAFAPYRTPQWWYGQRSAGHEAALPELYVHLVADPQRLVEEDLRGALEQIGAFGFGRDASIGLGKFELVSLEAAELPRQAGADAWLTLAPCAPQGLPWRSEHCFYAPFTRFGRHGDLAVHGGNPFKTPVLLADTAAVLTPESFEPRLFVGQGLGGDGRLSKRIAGTVHQGYAPVVGLNLAGRRDGAAA